MASTRGLAAAGAAAPRSGPRGSGSVPRPSGRLPRTSSTPAVSRASSSTRQHSMQSISKVPEAWRPSRHHGAPRSGNSSAGGVAHLDKAVKKVFADIRAAQDGRRNNYQQALGEIKAGHKQSHWIWYVWPALAPVRDTSRPQFSLPDFQAAMAYLREPVLAERLQEVSEAALEHLRAGSKPERVFGSSIDAIKFQETITCFAIAAIEVGDIARAQLFLACLDAYGGKLDANTCDYVANSGGGQYRRKYHGVSTTTDLAAMMAPAAVGDVEAPKEEEDCTS